MCIECYSSFSMKSLLLMWWASTKYEHKQIYIYIYKYSSRVQLWSSPVASVAVTSTLCPRMRLRQSWCPRVAAKWNLVIKKIDGDILREERQGMWQSAVQWRASEKGIGFKKRGWGWNLRTREQQSAWLLAISRICSLKVNKPQGLYWL